MLNKLPSGFLLHYLKCFWWALFKSTFIIWALVDVAQGLGLWSVSYPEVRHTPRYCDIWQLNLSPLSWGNKTWNQKCWPCSVNYNHLKTYLVAGDISAACRTQVANLYTLRMISSCNPKALCLRMFLSSLLVRFMFMGNVFAGAALSQDPVDVSHTQR